MSGSIINGTHFLKGFTASWLVWAALQAMVLYWLGIGLQVAIIDSLIFNSLIAGGCLLEIYIMQFYLPQKERYWYILAIGIFLSTILVYTGKWFCTYVISDVDDYLQLLQASMPIRFGIGFLLIVCMGMLGILWYSLQDQQEKEKRQADAARMAREAELFNLRQQLQPHFLFNSLNSISALVGTRPEEARHMIQQLSTFLRGTIKKEEQQLITLAAELEHLQLYLEIEKVRFGHRLVTDIKTNDKSRQLMLPSLLLQPIVENAIKFGLYDTTEIVNITIEAKAIPQQLVITIQNPFDPQTAPPQKGAGFGLSSVQRRLYLLFARNDLVSTSAEENIFTTTIIIPQLV